MYNLKPQNQKSKKEIYSFKWSCNWGRNFTHYFECTTLQCQCHNINKVISNLLSHNRDQKLVRGIFYSFFKFLPYPVQTQSTSKCSHLSEQPGSEHIGCSWIAKSDCSRKSSLCQLWRLGQMRSKDQGEGLPTATPSRGSFKAVHILINSRNSQFPSWLCTSPPFLFYCMFFINIPQNVDYELDKEYILPEPHQGPRPRTSPTVL